MDTSGHLGTVVSSARFKDAPKPMDKASEVILALQPVTFRYKHDLDPKGVPQFGLVAEEVEKVNPDLVARDEQGKPYTVRYEAVNAMLLNEFLKEHRTVQEQKTTIVELKHNFAEQQKQIEALTVGLQKVNAQLELSKPAPQTALSRSFFNLAISARRFSTSDSVDFSWVLIVGLRQAGEAVAILPVTLRVFRSVANSNRVLGRRAGTKSDCNARGR